MPDWLIKIVSVTPANPGDPTAAFDPATQDALEADNITWTNKTDDEHQPVPLNPPTPAWGVDAVPPWQSSNPTYSVAAPEDSKGNPIYGPVTYQCKNHPKEVGTINILKNPPTFT